ncbi:glycosyltransferase family 87 protein [Nocardia africana]|uniref:Glycosyltransferase family 87 protein n=1 Tax=Nocardia africana TaxID=134964 RepID=A0ABW6NCF3_9NOCA
MARLARVMGWPLAVVTFLDVVFVRAFHGDITNDFKPVHAAAAAFLHHRPVYSEDLSMVDPHYLYGPGATLLLSPLGLLPQSSAREVFVLANALAIIAATHLLLNLFGYTIRSVITPLCYAAVFASETVVNTLTFGNINGFTFLAEMAFLWLLLRRRDLTAGIVLGLTITVKPILAPLLLIAAARRQWHTIAAAIAVPVAITALAWPISVDPLTYLRHTLPYSLQARDYFNSSIAGTGLYYGIPPLMTLAVRVLLAVIVAISLWLLYRYYSHEEVLFVCTAAGVLMTAEFTLSTLGQQYYSMFIFPLLMTIVVPGSVVRNWPAWVAVFGFTTYDKWLLDHWPDKGRDLEYLRITLGWTLLLIVVFCVLTDRYLSTRRREHQFLTDKTPHQPAMIPYPEEPSRRRVDHAPIRHPGPTSPSIRRRSPGDIPTTAGN